MNRTISRKAAGVVGGLALAGALALSVGSGAAVNAGDPLNNGAPVLAAGDVNTSAQQRLISLDGHIQRVFTGTHCIDSQYGSGKVAARSCSQQDDQGALGGTWIGLRAYSWNPPGPLGRDGDYINYARKYNGSLQSCTGPGGSCIYWPDGWTMSFETDEVKSSSVTIWWQIGGKSDTGVDYCRRVFFSEAGGHSEEILPADPSTVVC